MASISKTDLITRARNCDVAMLVHMMTFTPKLSLVIHSSLGASAGVAENDDHVQYSPSIIRKMCVCLKPHLCPQFWQSKRDAIYTVRLLLASFGFWTSLCLVFELFARSSLTLAKNAGQ